MADPLWRIGCPWGGVFATTEAKAHEVADLYDSNCGCRIGKGVGPGSHLIERGEGHPVTSWKAIETVTRSGSTPTPKASS